MRLEEHFESSSTLQPRASQIGSFVLELRRSGRVWSLAGWQRHFLRQAAWHLAIAGARAAPAPAI